MLWKNLQKLLRWEFRRVLQAFLILTPLLSVGQWVNKSEIPENQNRRVESQSSFTAFAVVLDSESGPSSIAVMVDKIFFQVNRDPDSPRPTYFLSLENRASNVHVNYSGGFNIHFINSGTTPGQDKLLRQKLDDCYEFEAIPQSSWREGLPSPSFNRIANEVAHLIVHHTAGSNTNANYTQVVRDIYLFHTEVNGWSDIGYNFIISQDGSIYEGRDPGNDLTEFEVVGAHFCAKNTGTMGVAMLGNYETAIPDSIALQSLEQVLTSAADRFDLEPVGESRHRGQDLGHIAGHRDGCATLCPGENLYSLLPALRESVSVNIEAGCEEPETPPLAWNVYPNPISTGESLNVSAPDSVISATLTLLSGQINKPVSFDGGQISLAGIPPGLYVLTLVSQNERINKKVAIQ